MTVLTGQSCKEFTTVGYFVVVFLVMMLPVNAGFSVSGVDRRPHPDYKCVIFRAFPQTHSYMILEEVCKTLVRPASSFKTQVLQKIKLFFTSL